jgi:ABC-type amino acid transport substrate-binding protein
MTRIVVATVLVALAGCVIAELPDVASAQQYGRTSSQAAPTQSGSDPLRIATKEIAPFVTLGPEGPTGFSVDLWVEMADVAGIEYEWVYVDTVDEQLAGVLTGEADAAIAAISMTPDREATLDFSYAYFRSGLAILTQSHPAGSFARLFSVLLSPRLLAVYAVMLLVLVVIGHVVWLAERRRNDQYPTRYLPGIWEGIWWAAATVTTVGYGDRTVKGVAGRVLGLVWMFFGLFLIANFTAVVTAELTVAEISGRVRGEDDLRRHRVASVPGTTASEYLSQNGIRFVPAQDAGDAVDMLEHGDVGAVVFDYPVLAHEIDVRRDPRLQLVGDLLTREHYAIALPPRSPHEETINEALLRIYDDGTYAELLDKWRLAGVN